MDGYLQDAERYLTARLSECDRRLDLHQHTAEVYRSYLKIIHERPQDYIKEAGDMFAVMKAEHLDRNENFAGLSRKFNQQERVKAYNTRAQSVKSTTGYGDFFLKNGDAQKQTEPLLGIEYQRRDLVAEFFRLIVAWRVAHSADKSAGARKAAKAWDELKKNDPEISWQRFRSHPPYRNCLYYNDEQFDLLEHWFKEIIS
jgi:hypothetical protein